MRGVVYAVFVLLVGVSDVAEAQSSADVAEPGVVAITAVPARVSRAASEHCPGFLMNSARFNWGSDEGLYVLRGRCRGSDVEIHVATGGRVLYFAEVEPS